VLPTSISKWSLTTLVQLVEGKLPQELQPEHDILGANPAIHSSLMENIKVGRITPRRAGVGEITATGLSLANGETIDNLDAIILCTGYDIEYPFIPEDCYRSKHSKFMDSPNSVHLYRLTVPPHIRNLFIMGVFQLPGPIQPAVELQARWVTAILTGRIKLPPAERMSELIASEEEERARQWIQSDRHTVSAHFLPYCDSLANDLGAAPTFGRLLSRIFSSNPIRAMSILHAVYFGMCSSAQYRLFGDGSKPEIATATILRLARGGKQLSEEEKIALTKSEDTSASAVSHVDRLETIIVDDGKDARVV
jgi:dimethylaniline monooxygenase (N-oxide forming)